MPTIARRPLRMTGGVLPINTDDPFISTEKLASMPRPVDPYHLGNIQPMAPGQIFRAGDWQSVSPEHLERVGSSGLVREMRPKRAYDMVDVRPAINMARIYTQVDHPYSSVPYSAGLDPTPANTPAFAIAHPQVPSKRRLQHDVLEDQYSAPKWDHHQFHRRKLNERIRLMPSQPHYGDDESEGSSLWHEAHRPRNQPVHWPHANTSQAPASTWTASPTDCPSPTLGHAARFEDASSSSITIGTPSSGESDYTDHSGSDFSSWFSGVQSSPRLSGFKPYRPSIGLMISESEKEARLRHCANEVGGLGLVM